MKNQEVKQPEYVFSDEMHIQQSPIIEHFSNLSYPFTLISRIEVKTERIDKNKKIQETFTGTGIVIAECIILTCLHNLLNQQTKLPANKEKIKVYVGQNGQPQPQKVYQVRDIKYNQAYFKSKKNNQQPDKRYDYALIYLKAKKNKMIPIGRSNQLQLSQPRQLNYIFQMYGYDSELNSQYNEKNNTQGQKRLYGCQSDIYFMNDKFIYYKVSTQAGKSGAPLITYCRQGIFKIIGIHLGSQWQKDNKSASIVNYALQINDEMIADLRSWLISWKKSEKVLNPKQTKQFLHGKKENNINQQQKEVGQLDKQIQTENPLNSSWTLQFLPKTGQFLQNPLLIPFGISLLKKKEVKNQQMNQQYKNRPSQYLYSFDSDKNYHHNEQITEKITCRPNFSYIELPLNNTFKFYPQLQLTQLSQNRSLQFQTAPQLQTKEQIQEYLKISKTENEKQISIKNIYVNFNLIPQYFINIKKLTLNSCSLIKVPILQRLTQLQIIDCSSNFIVQISNFFTNYILQLNLDQNQIKQIPEQISKATKLQKLKISKNKTLKKIHKNILNSKIKHIEMRGHIQLEQSADDWLNQLIDLDVWVERD